MYICMYSLYFITLQRSGTRTVTKPLRSIRPEHRGTFHTQFWLTAIYIMTYISNPSLFIYIYIYTKRTGDLQNCRASEKSRGFTTKTRFLKRTCFFKSSWYFIILCTCPIISSGIHKKNIYHSWHPCNLRKECWKRQLWGSKSWIQLSGASLSCKAGLNPHHRAPRNQSPEPIFLLRLTTG